MVEHAAPADRAERQDEVRRQLDRFGIEHPTDERGWIMAAWETSKLPQG